VAPSLTARPLTAETADLAAGTAAVSVDHRTRIGPQALKALSRRGVRYLSTRSVGSDHIDCAYAARVGITVGNVAYSPDSVADHTLMLMLMALRNTRTLLRRVEAHDYRLSDTRGRELRDLTVGVVGTGRIGTAVIERLRGFGCRLLAHDVRGTGEPVADVPYVGLTTLLRTSDIVTLHTPLTEATHHLLDAEALAQTRQGAILVNTGRGGLVDTRALVHALESGELGGAALDVIEGENGIFSTDRTQVPIEDDVWLRLHAQAGVLITPHTAYDTDHALRDMVEHTLTACVQALEVRGGRHG